MDSSTTALIFVIVLVGVAILYCLFRVCGGRITDLLSCNFCRGPCCDCWGTGGRIDADELQSTQPLGYYPYLPPMSQLGNTIHTNPIRQPRIVIVNQHRDGLSSSSDDTSSENTSSDDTSDDADDISEGGTKERRGRKKRRMRRERGGRRRREDPSIYSRRDNNFDFERQGGVVVV